MRTLKLLIVALAVMLGAESVYAGETATLTKRRRGSTASILPGYWHRNFKEAKKYADDHGIPFIAGTDCPVTTCSSSSDSPLVTIITVTA